MSTAQTEPATVPASENTETRRYVGAVGGESSAGSSSAVTPACATVYDQPKWPTCDRKCKCNHGCVRISGIYVMWTVQVCAAALYEYVFKPFGMLFL